MQAAVEPGLDDLVQFTGHEGDHLDAVCGNHSVQRPGDRSADKRADAQFRQAERLLNGQVVRQNFLRLLDDPPRRDLDEVEPPGDVEDRCDPLVPAGECRFHGPLPSTPHHHGDKAPGVPTRFGREKTHKVP
jgi:hypothetical protein